jgi:hypothetical protein
MRIRIALAACLLVFAADARAQDKSDCIVAAERGQSLRDEGKLIEAKQSFASCAQPTCPNIVQTDCTRWMEKAAADIPTLLPRARDPNNVDLLDAKFYVDGKLLAESLDGRKVQVNPGTHTIRFEAPGMVANEQRVVVVEGERRDLLVYLRPPTTGARTDPGTTTTPPPPPPDAPPSHTPWAGWALGGVAIVGFATFATFAAIGTGDANDLRSGCSGTATCSQSDVDDVKTKYLVADIGLVVGLVALAGAAVIFLTQPKRTSHGLVVDGVRF